MARIPREEHATIRRMADVEGRKVAEIASHYGCTPANIYALLSKLRRQDQPAPNGVPTPPENSDVISASPEASTSPDNEGSRPPADDLFEAAKQAGPPMVVSDAAREAVAPRPSAVTESSLPPSREPANASAPPQNDVHAAQRDRGRSPSKAVAASTTPRAGKSGFALLMRTADGEEAVNPFRSIDDLLAACKPLLRTAARSPDPIWFSIQPVDLAALEENV